MGSCQGTGAIRSTKPRLKARGPHEQGSRGRKGGHASPIPKGGPKAEPSPGGSYQDTGISEPATAGREPAMALPAPGDPRLLSAGRGSVRAGPGRGPAPSWGPPTAGSAHFLPSTQHRRERVSGPPEAGALTAGSVSRQGSGALPGACGPAGPPSGPVAPSPGGAASLKENEGAPSAPHSTPPSSHRGHDPGHHHDLGRAAPPTHRLLPALPGPDGSALPRPRKPDPLSPPASHPQPSSRTPPPGAHLR